MISKRELLHLLRKESPDLNNYIFDLKKKIFVFLCFLCVVYSNFSQTSKDLRVTIDAFILDYSTKEPIAFAEIELLNKNLGTLSDHKGKFSLTFLQSKLSLKQFWKFQALDSMYLVKMERVGFLENTNKFYLIRNTTH